MKKLLRIVVPTFNRKEKLNLQLDFLKSEIEQDNSILIDVEFYVYDNSSNDNTRNLLENFSCKNTWLNFQINQKNIGLVGNINKLNLESTAMFTWAIGDDDNLEKGIIIEVVNILKKHNDINWLFINHDAFDTKTLSIELKSAFINSGGYYDNGKEVITDIFLHSRTTPMFITACVYNTETIVEVINQVNTVHLVNPLRYSFYSASKGSVYLLDKILIHNKWGDSSWSKKMYEVMFQGVFTVLFDLKLYGYTKNQINLMINENIKYNKKNYLIGILKLKKIAIKLSPLFINFFLKKK
jgi:hypothetical protein